MENLREMTVQDYIGVLGSSAPAPGGGSAAALAGAQGAALGAMAAALTIGKKKYAEHEALMTTARDALTMLAHELTLDIDRDTQAFDTVCAAMKMPRATAEEQALRSAETQRALMLATRSPMAICRHCLDALVQMEAIAGKFNISTASDLGTGAAMLRAAAQGAWLNILINVSALKDRAQADALHAEGQALQRQAVDTADTLFAKMQKLCMP